MPNFKNSKFLYSNQSGALIVPELLFKTMKSQFKNEWIESEIITVSESVDKDEVFISDADTPNGWNDICILIKPDEAIKFANFIIEVANHILISKKSEDDDTPFTFKELEEKHGLPFCF